MDSAGPPEAGRWGWAWAVAASALGHLILAAALFLGAAMVLPGHREDTPPLDVALVEVPGAAPAPGPERPAVVGAPVAEPGPAPERPRAEARVPSREKPRVPVAPNVQKPPKPVAVEPVRAPSPAPVEKALAPPPGKSGPAGDAPAPDPAGGSLPEEGGQAVALSGGLERAGGGAPSPRTPYLPGELDQALLPLERDAPAYPLAARRMNVEGTVTVTFVVTDRGEVRDAEVVRAEPPGFFEDAALNAVARWRFEPGKKGGRPVDTRVTVPVVFRLE